MMSLSSRAGFKTAKQISDGHLAQLAKANGAILATLDPGIPRAFLIPPNQSATRESNVMHKLKHHCRQGVGVV
jgi:hypothetical protein